MMHSRRHVIVDTNLLIYYLHPKSSTAKTPAERARVLLDAAIHVAWPSLKLYVPAISVAEAIGVLDKYRYCKWAGPAKKNSALRLTPRAYGDARASLASALQDRQLEQIEHEPAHVWLTSLISPVNQAYQYRRGKPPRVKPPMGGADCLIGGIAVLLNHRIGQDGVLLATADQRLSDVMTKCRSLTKAQAKKLGLIDAAQAVGLTWSPQVYPRVVNLRDARVAALRQSFFGWPLPGSRLAEPASDDLAKYDQAISDEWERVARRHKLKNPDSLPYTAAIDDLRTGLAVEAGVLLSNDLIFRRLLTIRKAGKLPRSGSK